jgi:hypothetical protein
MFSEEKARKIAEDFLSKANPTNWNGVGRRPKNFSTGIVTYNIDSINGNELDSSFEYLDEDESDIPGWTHYCELRDKETGDLMIPLHGYGIDSVQNLVDTIMDICSDEN